VRNGSPSPPTSICTHSHIQSRAHTSLSYCTPFTHTLSISIYAFANITSDVLVLAIPLVIFHYITVPPREKYAIFFLLFLGIATIATTATCCALHITYRTYLLVYYNYIQIAELLACIELSVAVCAVSLPSLKAVLYRKREDRRRRGEIKRSTAYTATTASGSNMMGDDGWEEDDDDAGGLVIMRRISYGVESLHGETSLPPAPEAALGV